MSNDYGPWIHSLFEGAKVLKEYGIPFMRIPGSDENKPCKAVAMRLAENVKIPLDE
jgi:hypothetical protein